MKTKLLIVLVAAALMLTISGTTQAGTLRANGWNLPVRYHLTNYDQGAIWLNSDGSFPTEGFYGDPRAAGLVPFGVDNPMSPNEDTWGIANIDQIRRAWVDENHNNLEPHIEPALYNIGDPDSSGTPMELWGMFYGETDEWLYVTGAGGQEVMGSGLKFQIWAQPLGAFESVHGPIGNKQFGSADRLAVDRYAGIGYDAANNPIPGAYLWLSGEAPDGFLIEPDTGIRDHQMASQWAAPGNLDGEAQLWAEFWGGDDAQITDGPVGSANQAWDYNWYWADMGANPDYVADMRLQLDNKMVADQNDIWDWEVTSSDPGQMYGVPEPITMLGVFLGVSSLTGYIRKRRMA